jgi:ribosomal protein S18 acetylase RimI-like enzyme
MWRIDLFYASWLGSENFILESDGERIGVLRVKEKGDLLRICDVQVAIGHRGLGAGTYMLDMAHIEARARGLRGLQLCAFVDNPAVQLYLRMGYRIIQPTGGQHPSIHNMERPV